MVGLIFRDLFLVFDEHDRLGQPQSMRKIPSIPWRSLAVIAAVACGVAAGLGFYAFNYGEGLSYFSKDPRACANCHVMEDAYDSWQKGGHHQAATCAVF
jgi:cytochrome c nitrite reductase small subunit